MFFTYLIVVTILSIGAILSVKARKVTTIGGLTGFVVSLLLFIGAGCTSLAMLAVFFLMGTTATSLGMKKKQQAGLAEKKKGKRAAGQVVANAGIPGLLALFCLLDPSNKATFVPMIAGAFASATADTLSSEIGNLYGTNFYNVLTFKTDTKGLDGVVSVEGTLAGAIGTICIASTYAAGYGITVTFFLIIVAGNLGNLFDSILGATLQRKQYLGNDAVNLLNTFVAAFIMLLSNLFA